MSVLDWFRPKRKVYKVVCLVSQGVKQSFVAEFSAAVRYEEGKWVSAPEWLTESGYWLTCFRNLKSAEAFLLTYADSGYDYELWESIADETKKALPPICATVPLGRRSFSPVEARGWPKGTLMAKRLKLTRKYANYCGLLNKYDIA